ncbi:MAG: glycoside hydrolase family 9 protein, partial [Calditrichota bacterium]
FYNSGTLETGCDNGEIIAGDADMPPDVQRDWLVTVAIYLFELTGDPSYNLFVASNYNLTEPIASGFWGVYRMDLNEAMLRYAQSGNGDPAASAAILSAASNEVLGNFNGYFGWVETDLYRSQIPEWSYHWGSSKSIAEYGNINELFIRAGIGDAASLKRKSAELLHYFHGVNPIGIVYLSNMYDYGADRSVNEIYHTWFADGTDYDNALTSPLGPAPGYVSGGPNPDFTVSSLVPPYGQPDQKSYLDFNTSWPDNSWEISEPAIYYQASYLRLLSNFVSSQVLTGTGDSFLTQNHETKVLLYPNPVKDMLYMRGLAAGSEIQIMNIAGQTVSKSRQISVDIPLGLSKLSAGIYLLRIKEPGAKKHRIARFVKL